ncbi:uncharacterized protein LOC119280056 [Triticum dicoccoides]|uniref:uncharacterized protein LOC119280056 n=1 Tax=Triticum dicoccoides TaxID=85692 RepID=UPI00188DF3B9|nr:uncharacterized protein LOC119280056 [Triticum dicoccoides]
MAAAALLLLLVSLATAAAAPPTSNTSDTRSEENWRMFMDWKAMNGTTNSSLAEEEQRAYTMFKHRLGLIDRRWHDEGYSVFSWERGRSEEDTRKIFVEWKVREGVTYSSIAHEEHRYTIFKEALRDIDQHNSDYAIGVYNNNRCIDQFSHLIQEEYEAVCCGYSEVMPSEAELQRVGEILERLWQAHGTDHSASIFHVCAQASPNLYYSERLAKSFQHIFTGTITIGDMEQSYYLARQLVVTILSCDISNQKAVPTLAPYRFI